MPDEPIRAELILHRASEEALLKRALDAEHQVATLTNQNICHLATISHQEGELSVLREFAERYRDGSASAGQTVTGRVSSSGPQLQNIPVRTEEGQKMVWCNCGCAYQGYACATCPKCGRSL